MRPPRENQLEQPVGGVFVRLLDGTGEFTAEVVTSSWGTGI